MVCPMPAPKLAKDMTNEVPFRLQSMTLTPSPEGSDGRWYRYVIAQGTNLITGIRCGSETEVNAAVMDMIERLNERRAGKTRPKGKPAQAARAVPPQATPSAV
jgi:hypothetical protein